MFSRDAKQHGQHVATVWQLDCGITLHPFGFGWFTIGYVLRSCGCWALFGISSCIQSLNPDNRNGIGQSCCIFQVPDGSRCVPYEKPSWLPHVVTSDRKSLSIRHIDWSSWWLLLQPYLRSARVGFDELDGSDSSFQRRIQVFLDLSIIQVSILISGHFGHF